MFTLKFENVVELWQLTLSDVSSKLEGELVDVGGGVRAGVCKEAPIEIELLLWQEVKTLPANFSPG